MQDSLNIVVRWKKVEILALLRKLYGVELPTVGGISSFMYDGAILCETLYINFNFWFLLLNANESHPHSLYSRSSDTDLVKPVTMRAASIFNMI